MARDRAPAAGQPVQAGADEGAAAAVAVVLPRSRSAAPSGRVAAGLLGRFLLHGAHGAAPAPDVRRADASRRWRAVAAVARRAAWPVRPVGDPRRHDRRLVPAAAI